MNKKQLENQIGCCFTIDGEEWIYNGSIKPEAKYGYECDKCHKENHNLLHEFYKIDNNKQTIVKYFGGTCVNTIIQAGFIR